MITIHADAVTSFERLTDLLSLSIVLMLCGMLIALCWWMVRRPNRLARKLQAQHSTTPEDTTKTNLDKEMP